MYRRCLARWASGLLLMYPLVGGCSRPTAFVRHEIHRSYSMDDLGVADLDSDGWLDIFSTNHSYREALLRNDRRGSFQDKLLEWGLGQCIEAPSLASSPLKPKLDRPGLYAYSDGLQLVLQAHQQKTPLSGVIVASEPVDLEGPAQKREPGGRKSVRIEFSLSADQSVRVLGRGRNRKPIHSLEFAPETDLSAVYLGPEKHSPRGYQLRLKGRDRHGFAWVDYDGDGDCDLFSSRGGGSGKMKASPENNDELFLRSPQGYRDEAGPLGIVKGVGSGRQAQWVDQNRDGRLDLHHVCGRNAPPRNHQPHQLYIQTPTGTLRDEANARGLLLRRPGLARWLDLDMDLWPDLLWSDRKGAAVLLNQGGALQPPISVGLSRSTPTITDLDGDGRPECYYADSITLLTILSDGTIEPLEAAPLGLPSSQEAHFVDVDLDGLVDLHLLPGGIYRQEKSSKSTGPPLRFVATGWLRDVHYDDLKYSGWFDADNDGDLDFVAAENVTRGPGGCREYQIFLYENQLKSGHWLQLELVGPAGNAPALGYRVEVRSGQLTQQAQVGQHEFSRRSHGHYRLYFGLGERTKVDEIRVVAPTGVFRFSSPRADRLARLDVRPPTSARGESEDLERPTSFEPAVAD